MTNRKSLISEIVVSFSNNRQTKGRRQETGRGGWEETSDCGQGDRKGEVVEGCARRVKVLRVISRRKDHEDKLPDGNDAREGGVVASDNTAHVHVGRLYGWRLFSGSIR